MAHRDEEAARRARDYARTEMMRMGEELISLDAQLKDVLRRLDVVERQIVNGVPLGVMW